MLCRPWFNVQNWWNSLWGPKYDGNKLHETIRNKLPEDMKVADTVTNIVVPAFDIKYLQPIIFNMFEAKEESHKNALLTDICIGTSAAPTYFPAYCFTTKGSDGKPHQFDLIDGGAAANNPTMVAMSVLKMEMLRVSQSLDDKLVTTGPDNYKEVHINGGATANNPTTAAMAVLTKETLRQNKDPTDYKSFLIISLVYKSFRPWRSHF